MKLAKRHWMKGSYVALEHLEMVWFASEGLKNKRSEIRKTKLGGCNVSMCLDFFLSTVFVFLFLYLSLVLHLLKSDAKSSFKLWNFGCVEESDYLFHFALIRMRLA